MQIRRRGSRSKSLLLVAALALGSLAWTTNRPPPTDPALEVLQAHAVAPSASTLRLVTYNIHGIRSRELVSAIAEARHGGSADVLALQEVTRKPDGRSEACLAAEEMLMNCIYAPGHGLAGGGDLGVALVSRFSLRDAELIELPYYSTVVNSGRRVALGATLDIEAVPTRVFAVHLDNRINPVERARQLTPVLDAADRYNLPTIIAGDLNTSPFVFGFHLIPFPTGGQARRLERLVRQRGFSTPVVDVGATHKLVGMRLDAIYTRGLDVQRHGVDSDVTASDHFPLWADLTILATS